MDDKRIGRGASGSGAFDLFVVYRAVSSVIDRKFAEYMDLDASSDGILFREVCKTFGCCGDGPKTSQ